MDYVSCPLLYRFRCVDRLPEPPSRAATRGTLVHAVLEQMFDLPAKQRTLPIAMSLLPGAWAELLRVDPDLIEMFLAVAPADVGDASAGDTSPGDTPVADKVGDKVAGELLPSQQEWLAGAEKLLGTYFKLEDPTRLEPAEREVLVTAELEGGLVLRGYIDRLDVAPATGDVRVVDYKTGRAPAPGWEAKPMFQLKCYALALWKRDNRVPRMLQLLYLGSAEVVRYVPTEADLQATERKLIAIWQAVSRAYDSGDWRPNKSRLCDWCAHKSLCPAWGGTPPPLPSVPVAAKSGPRSARGPAEPAVEQPSPRAPLDEI